MRPIKQVGVISNHTLLGFAPGGAIAVGASILLFHVTREGFLFLSACMLTYSYRDLARGGYRRFYKRRFVAVGIPYLAWTLIYFGLRMVFPLKGVSYTPLGALAHLGYLVGTGYYQLYYLIVIMQFYLVFPLFLLLLRATQRHHKWLLSISLVLQLVLVSLIHWSHLPSWMLGLAASREFTSYQFYLVGGMVVAWHLDTIDAWLRSHAHLVLAATAAAAAVAELWYTLDSTGTVIGLGGPTDPFQPIVVPFYIGAICSLYLLGVWLADARRSTRLRALVRSGSDNSYGIYLSQMLFIVPLEAWGWRNLDGVIPWPVVSLFTVVLVFVGCGLLTGLLARTPLAFALTGRQRQSWQSLIPSRRTSPGMEGALSVNVGDHE
ncbi:MAG: acyltransferase [Candidatus Dormiibacterota bacterium]